MSVTSILIKANPYTKVIEYFNDSNNERITSTLNSDFYSNTTIRERAAEIIYKLEEIYGGADGINISFIGTDVDFKAIKYILNSEEYRDKGIQINRNAITIVDPGELKEYFDEQLRKLEADDKEAANYVNEKIRKYDDSLEAVNNGCMEIYKDVENSYIFDLGCWNAVNDLISETEKRIRKTDSPIDKEEILKKVKTYGRDVTDELNDYKRNIEQFFSEMERKYAEFKEIKSKNFEAKEEEIKGKNKKITPSAQASGEKKKAKEAWESRTEELFNGIEAVINKGKTTYLDRIKAYLDNMSISNDLTTNVIKEKVSEINLRYVDKKIRKDIGDAFSSWGDIKKNSNKWKESVLLVYRENVDKLNQAFDDCCSIVADTLTGNGGKSVIEREKAKEKENYLNRQLRLEKIRKDVIVDYFGEVTV